MTPLDELVTRLQSHAWVGQAPVTELQWLATHGTLREVAAGTVIVAKGQPSTHLNVVLSGRLAIHSDGGAGRRKLFEWKAGEVSGAMPYSRGASPPNDVVAEEPTEMLMIDHRDMPTLIRECPAVTAVLVHAMIDRARQFTSNNLRDEKLLSLGKLAAGLAHELNNPASAVVRGAKLLSESLDASEQAARQLGTARLSEDQLALLDEIRALCLKAAPTMMRTALGRSDREDELTDWLVAHGADERCAGPLTETGITIDAMDRLAASVDGAVLNASLKWMAAGCNVRLLSGDVESAAARISHLVGAVKGFTFMDHAPTPEPVDIRQGILDTCTMLGAKTRTKSVQVDLQIADDLPRAQAVGGELNQVWMNLIENALDAVPIGGQVRVAGTFELGRVVVRIIDNGHGIPPEIVGRIFDPFFTTKGVGKGTGLGLDIVRRLLQQHDGDIAVTSVPGRTEFQVTLPAER